MTSDQTPPDSASTQRTIRNAIFCLSLAAFCSGSSLRVVDALLPRLSADFDISLSTASYAITSMAIAYGIAQLLFGPLGDRFGKFRVVAAVCASGIVTTLLCALAPTFWMLIVGRLLAGVSAAAIIPLAMAWIGDVIPYEQRQPVLARFLIGQILGLSSGVQMGGFAADHLGWRPPFFVIATLFAIASLLLFRIDRQLPAHARVTRKIEGGAIVRMVSEFGQVLAKPWARIVLRSVMLEGLFLYGAFAFIASHLHQAHGASMTIAGSVVMLFGIGGLLFAAGAEKLVRWFGEVGLIRWGGGLCALSVLGIGVSPSWAWALPACFLMGLGFYMMHNTLQINATQMAVERRGAAVSFFASFFFLGQSIGVVLAASLIPWMGTGGVIAVFSIGLFLTAWNFSSLKAAQIANGQPA